MTLTADITLTEQQERAVSTGLDFLGDGKRYSELRIGGYAGTGKTTILRTMLDRCNGKLRVAVAALAGKAVDVLRRKGINSAQTIHRTIYEYDPASRRFFLRRRISADAIIVDEASMVNEQLYHDLQSFGLPMIFVGDMGQLEPIGSDVNLMDESRLDVRLTEIMRQAAENPIIGFATTVRLGEEYADGDYGEVKIGGKLAFWQNLHNADRIICGTNRVRHQVNSRIRIDRGRREKLNSGEQLICIQNNRQFGVFNGMSFTVERIKSTTKLDTICDVRTEDGELLKDLPILTEQLGKDKDPDARFVQESVLCDYGYCITCHKAQGSEWDRVLVLEDSDRWDMRRWRYTAVTRAAKELVYCH